MTYAAQEVSTESGQPVELYEFTLGSATTRWTNNMVAIVYDSQTYTPIEIKRDAIRVSPGEKTSALTLTVPSSTSVVRNYINNVPGPKATVTVRRLHRNDGDDEAVQVFQGVVRTISFTLNGSTAEIAVLPISADMQKSMPRVVFSRTCNNFLFDANCSVNSSLFRHEGLVQDSDGAVLTIANLNTKGTGWANAGYVVTPGGDYRAILDHTDDDITLFMPFPSAPVGQTVEVYAGCDHSIATCVSKFSNGGRNGGFNWVPLRNLFQNGLDTA